MAEEDIFMDYAASSSPVHTEAPRQTSAIQLNIPKIGSSFDEILSERNIITTNLRNSSNSSSQETRLKILQMRKFNRHILNVITEHRKRLNELKDVVDNLNRKLLCQKFEKQHLLDEIKACLNSKNIFETIELEPLETGDPLLEISDSHELMIKRLQRELGRRQELQNQLISILQKKQQTELELEKKKLKIEDLRNNLQNLLKNSKPLIEACGYDLEGFNKKKMAVDEMISSSKIDKKEEIEIIYEKLISFVSDKPNFKLRYFDNLGDKNSNTSSLEDEEQEETVEEGRNPTIKTAYIQIKMEIDEFIDPIEIYLKISENFLLFLTIQHEFLPENLVISTWLKGLETKIEFLEANENNSNWLAPKRLQPDSLNFSQDSEIFNEIFSTLKEALQFRNSLQILVQDHSKFLEFDKNDPNQIILLPDGNLKAKITINSITWCTDGIDEDDLNLIVTLNSIGSKYRSVLDCLQAQLELLIKK